MKLQALLASLLVSSCCSSGTRVAVHPHVEATGAPAIVVYYPEHGTWNTFAMRATIEVDGEPVGRLCEGDFLVVPVEPGAHVLATSRDRESGCWNAALRPEGGWPPVEVVVADRPVYLRYGAEPYDGPSSMASICNRHLTPVDESLARIEVDRLDLIAR